MDVHDEAVALAESLGIDLDDLKEDAEEIQALENSYFEHPTKRDYFGPALTAIYIIHEAVDRLSPLQTAFFVKTHTPATGLKIESHLECARDLRTLLRQLNETRSCFAKYLRSLREEEHSTTDNADSASGPHRRKPTAGACHAALRIHRALHRVGHKRIGYSGALLLHDMGYLTAPPKTSERHDDNAVNQFWAFKNRGAQYEVAYEQADHEPESWFRKSGQLDTLGE